MKMLVCGGRAYQLTHDDFWWLGKWIDHYEVTEVVHGNCSGADRDAGGYAMGMGLKVTPFPADWEQFGKSAGPMRNQEMADYCEPGDVCAVFPGGKGTADMEKRARLRGLRILKQVVEEKK